MIGIYVPPRQKIVGEYLCKRDKPAWDRYRKYAQTLRQYRNVVVHDHLIGTIHVPGLGDLVPKKAKIGEYKRFFAIDGAKSDINKLKGDFILVQEQMIADFTEIQSHLQELWHAPIKDFRTLLFCDHNAKLLQKYDIQIKAE